eukprot:1060599-Pleurochrysis_carterae.AAC.4
MPCCIWDRLYLRIGCRAKYCFLRTDSRLKLRASQLNVGSMMAYRKCASTAYTSPCTKVVHAGNYYCTWRVAVPCCAL